jgi:protoheme IX farnesyltransferase
MERTRSRPVAAGRVDPAAAIVFGAILTVFGVVVLYGLTTPLAALMALVGNLFYVFVYTIWLKRRTPQNIVIGGAAGAMPPLVGWAAVTGDMALAPLFLFGLIFLWTPPHFWALALIKRDEYANAGVPMLPVTNGVRSTTIQILVYTVILVAFSLIVVPFGLLSWLYGAAALVLGARFLQLAVALHRERGDDERARVTFRYSLYYLAALFIAIAVDRILLG